MSEERPNVLLVNRCFIKDSVGRLLLIKRAANDSFEPGKWECPGGKLEKGEDVLHSLEAEVMQETGLYVTPQSRLVYHDSYTIASGKYAGLPYVVLFWTSNPVRNPVKLSKEHDDFSWLSYDQALDLELTPETRKALLALGEHLDQKHP